ncbi:MAG: exopolysaccharide biosynthesis protein [Succinivibrio sp.]|nr:exopolysaccharide biosynthesis protein [Succinivibrio sp.]
MKRLIISALVVWCCVGCESFTFTSNLDPDNFSNYYKPSSVETMTEEELQNVRHKSLGTVAGLACQAKDRDYIATEADARTDARIKAADMGADAIKMGRCVRLENTPACKVSITCYAEAYSVGESKH